jgi:hypothetical protein
MDGGGLPTNSLNLIILESVHFYGMYLVLLFTSDFLLSPQC